MEEGRSAFKILTANLHERDLEEGLGLDEKTMGLKEMGINTRNWVHSGHDRDYWRAVVNEALNLQDL